MTHPRHPRRQAPLSFLIALLLTCALSVAACTTEESTGNDAGSDTTSADTSGSTSADTSGSTSGTTSADTSGSTSADTSGSTSGTTGADTSGSTSDDTFIGQDTNSDDTDTSGPTYRGSCNPFIDMPCGDATASECLPIPNSPDGWHTCVSEPQQRTTCTAEPGGIFADECCDASECTTGEGGGCFDGLTWYCGGAAPQEHNACAYNACAQDSDCTAQPNGACVPRGAWNELGSVCVYSGCSFDADCDSRAGGQCMPFFDDCRSRFIGFSCTYDDSACRSDIDCNGSVPEYCVPGTDGATRCQEIFARP
jgi:predicted small secreted protein